MSRPPLVIVTAVRAETRAVLEAVRNVRRAEVPGRRTWHAESCGRAVTLVQAGIGRVRARSALEAIPTPHGSVVSVGFAGALVPDARPGDVALPSCILWEDPSGLRRYDVPTSPWRRIDARLAAALGAVQRGPMLSSPAIIGSPEEKRDAHHRTGAVAVEMEAAGLVPVAAERGVDLLVVRAILDAVDVSLAELPVDLDSSWSARAELLGRPRAWPSLWAVARQVPGAARTLRAAATIALAAL